MQSRSFFIMESGPVLTIADLRQQSNTNWCQDVELSFAFRRGEPLKVLMIPGLTLPKALFKYQLQQAVFEGTPLVAVKKKQFIFATRTCMRPWKTLLKWKGVMMTGKE